MGVSGEVHGEVGEGGAGCSECHHAVRVFLAVRFGKDVARSDVEYESGEHAQVHEKRVRRQSEEQRRERSGDWSEGVCEEESPRALLGILMREHESHGVHTVGESVRDDRERYRHPYRWIDLESEADADAVEKAVSDER